MTTALTMEGRSNIEGSREAAPLPWIPSRGVTRPGPRPRNKYKSRVSKTMNPAQPTSQIPGTERQSQPAPRPHLTCASYLSLNLRHQSWVGQLLGFTCTWQQHIGFCARGNLQSIHSHVSWKCTFTANLHHGPASHYSLYWCRIGKTLWDFMSVLSDRLQGSRIGSMILKKHRAGSMTNNTGGVMNTAGWVKILLPALWQIHSFLDVPIKSNQNLLQEHAIVKLYAFRLRG